MNDNHIEMAMRWWDSFGGVAASVARIEVNGRKLDIPSYKVLPGQEVRVAPSDREMLAVKVAQDQASRGATVSWLSVDAEKAAGRLTAIVTADAYVRYNLNNRFSAELVGTNLNDRYYADPLTRSLEKPG